MQKKKRFYHSLKVQVAHKYIFEIKSKEETSFYEYWSRCHMYT